MVELEVLAAEIKALGEKVKTMKADGSDKESIDSVVAALLTAKKTYAENNNGIGVDGQPYQESLSKKEKKSKGKEQQEQGVVKAEQQEDPNSKGAQKKAAKKAAAAAKKAAHKAEGKVETNDQSTAAAAAVTGSLPMASPPPLSTSIPPPLPNRASIGPKPLQVIINPNVPLIDRPIVAMAVAVLTNTAVDLDLYSDHRSRHTCLGSESGTTVVTGDISMARYLARRAGAVKLVPVEMEMAAAVDTWVDYAVSLQRLCQEVRYTSLALTLEHALHSDSSTYLVGSRLTLADLAIFGAVGFPTQVADLKDCLSGMPLKAVATRRWIRMMACHPALQEATQLCLGVGFMNQHDYEAVFDESMRMEPLVAGMTALEGAVAGRVVTRFPPEPSGYLHIGHAKAVLLNDYFATRYKGRMIVRFDDTNPSKEKEEYQESIVQDLAKLGVKPNLVTYTSDYFETILGYAKHMINNGLAYMDDTPQEQMKLERADRIESKHRNDSPSESMEFFNLMCSGGEESSAWCLRAKIDMQSDNGTLRDPVLFRQNLTPHHRSGTTYKAYPTYDLACPIVDSLEGVTHALRTTEYDDRNDQYQWVQKALGLRRTRVHTFSRVNFKNTVLSKRKLTWFVENGHVTGWDDARFPTIRGVVRRGINITALRQFMYSQGSSKRIVLMDWTVFWSENKKEIDKVAKRFMAVNQDNVKLTVKNAPTESDFAFVETSCHPKDPNLGVRSLRIANQVLLETVDVEDIKVGEEIVLLRWGVVKITQVDGTSSLEGEFVPNGDYKAAKRKLSWLAAVSNNTPVVLMEFDNLISKEKIEEDENFEDFINPDTLASTDVIGDAGLKTLMENDVIQLERRGYFRVDRPYINQSKPLILYMIPDGKAKAMSGQTGKLAHR